MKTLYIIRHAKSSWGDLTSPDFERPLNDRGKKDAPEMATRLKEKKAKIDVFISSPAKRAQKTCKAFCKIFDYPEEKVVFKEELYHAAVETFYNVITSIDNAHHSAAVFSHNPGITLFINSLKTAVQVDNMPTCGIFAVTTNIADWQDFKSARKEFALFDYPKASSADQQ